nr:unnamed protein product [Callosobruchus chinensis]
MHHEKGNDDCLPEIIEYYNSTKGGVDLLDQKCANYCCGRRTRRWPMAVFYRLLDIASSNSFVLYSAHEKNEEMSRLTFVKQLARELVLPHLERRYHNQRLPYELRTSIRRVLGVQAECAE